jgi:nucleoside-diphosphate-sugar epimerase
MAPVYADDLIDLIMLAIHSPDSDGRAYTGFGGETVTSAEFFNHYASMLGKDHVPTAPRPIAQLALLLLEFVARITGRPPQASRNAMVFIDRKAGYATTAASDELGWEPKVGLDEGMLRTAAWFRETGLLPDTPGA